jgi:uncharacterized protein (DUF1800 family)
VNHEQQIIHLLRRTGFGTSGKQIAKFSTMSIPEAVDVLLSGEEANLDLNVDFISRANNETIYSWYNQILGSTNDLQEKMALFWHNHFTTAIEATIPYLMHNQVQLLRKHALNRFEPFLNDISVDAAMMAYLNNRSNVKKAPNENYARELMELFTLGIGNYTQDDIKEVARCLTGWRYNSQNDTVYFDSALYDDGEKSLFGRRGNFNLSDVMNIISSHPQCAKFITTKIWKKFVHPSPLLEDIEPAAAVFMESGLDIKELLRHIFTSERFYADKNARSVIKDPTEFAIEIMRKQPGYEFPIGDLNLIFQMGMPLMKPPNVAGWKEGERWLAPSYLFARGSFAAKATNNASFDSVGLSKSTKPAEMVEALLAYTGMADMTANSKAQLADYAASTTDAVMRLRGLLYLIYVSPEANVK